MKGQENLTSNPLALQLYTLRDQLPAGRKAVLQAVKGFGYGAVEPYDVLTDPEALRGDLDEAGLAVCSVHAKALGDDTDAMLAGARKLGADTVIVPWAPPERFADRVRYLHVKDGPVTRDDPMTAVGAGRMPVADILAACPSAEWHVVELDRCGTDMLTAVSGSIAWLTSRGLATAVTAG